ncbi:MAG TPA: hypothetical protein VMM59_11735 [Thermohalobaculum sp.]|nr:hypothetical protein [Thermohalobaculum sp.]
MRVWAALAGALAAAAPTPAAAHAFAERYDLPLPLGFYLAGAGAAVALSFLGSSLLMRPGRLALRELAVPLPPGAARAARWLLRAVALALLAAVIVTALAGPASPTRNFATVFVWVIWWVGFVLFTALVVDLWSAANPFRLLVERMLRVAGLGRRERPLPATAGWLAVAGLLAIAWLELVSDWAEQPRALAALVAVYFAGLVAGAALMGPAGWFAAADPLTRIFGLLGRLAPLEARGGVLRVRLPGAGLIGFDPGAPGAVFVLALIGTVLFDGLSETPFWAAVLDWVTRSEAVRPWLLALRDGGVDILKLVRTCGLLATVAAAVLSYAALSLAMARSAGAAGDAPGAGRVFTRFAASLLPIAVAYHLAHYASYLVLAGQLMLPILSDPLGLGWDLIGTANRRIDLGVIDARAVWWIAAAALVTGHALSVFVAHAEALSLYGDGRRAVRSQLPMMVCMVGLTGLSLWILSQPIVA